MFKLVTEQLGQEAIIVDADDLLKHPGNEFMHGLIDSRINEWIDVWMDRRLNE